MPKQNEPHNALEKATFAFGIAVLLCLLSYLTYQIVHKENKPPQLVITSTYKAEVTPYAFKVDVENIGQKTASNVMLQLSLYKDGKVAEKGTINFNYVPVNSTKTGWIVFDKKRKTTDSLVVSSITYAIP